MIRINLLPTKTAPRRQAAVLQIVAFLAVAAVAVAGLLSLDVWQKRRVLSQQRANSVIQNRIERIRSQIRDHDQIRAGIEEIEGKQRVIEELQNGRTGPVLVMVELAKVLGRTGAPTIDHDRYMNLIRRSPGQAYDPNWDGRRLWLRSFREQERQVDLRGSAMSHEDVAEFLRRLWLSDYFYDVTLMSTRTESADSPTVIFQIQCRLRYGGLTPETEPDGEPPTTAAPGA